MDIVSKINGNTLSATEFNQMPTELEALQTSSGQTSSDAVLNQVSIGVARYAANNFYIDSGAADAYVLTLAASMTNPVSATVPYFIGMTIRFRAGNAGTGGAATVNVNGAGVKSLKESDGTTDPTSIPTTEDTEWRYDGTVFRRVTNYPILNEFYAWLGSDLTVSSGVTTKINLNNKGFDDGGYFDNTTNYRWTPPAGRYYVSFGIDSKDAGVSEQGATVLLYKNGSFYKSAIMPYYDNGSAVMSTTSIIYMNGADYLELYCNISGSGTLQVAGSIMTFMFGFLLNKQGA
jgi:hypothetical protein